MRLLILLLLTSCATPYQQAVTDFNECIELVGKHDPRVRACNEHWEAVMALQGDDVKMQGREL